MAKQLLKFLLAFTAVMFLVKCAQIAPLNGGKKDLNPPKLLQALPANYGSHFNTGVILLLFDEYVKLKDLNNQLVVSPKLKTTPDIETSGRKIKISLKREELSPNTTYRIYFGQAIVDMNEGNAIQNFEYVFSTGDYIDSLKLKGDVTDAFNNKPVGATLIGLYESKDASDSLPYKEVPDYLSKSSDNGTFSFGNLPYKKFKAYAFSDKNKNYLYDGETEKIAFLNSELNLVSDSAIKFDLFQEESSKGFIKKTLQPYPGFMQIILNKKSNVELATLNPRDEPNIFEIKKDVEKDTVSLYYKDVSDTLGLVLANLTQRKTDTLRIALSKKSANRKRFKSFSLNTAGNNLALGTKPTISFLNWMNILRADPSKIRLSSKEDSLISQVDIKGKWLDINNYEIQNEFKEGVNYTLKIDTTAFFDINGISNDSASINFKTQTRTEYGKVTLKLLFNKKQPYIVQLINEKEQVIRQAFVTLPLSSSNATSLDFVDLTPAVYLVKIIFDSNGNKKWDTGNLISKRQPEHVFINAKQIKVLSDWEIEEEILIKE